MPFQKGHVPHNKGTKSSDVAKAIARFWSKVIVTGPDECWICDTSHGAIYWFGRPIFVARVSWFIHHGIMPELDVLHKCDNPDCVNPSHLFLGTQTDNMIDMWRKGRANPRGLW